MLSSEPFVPAIQFVIGHYPPGIAEIMLLHEVRFCCQISSVFYPAIVEEADIVQPAYGLRNGVLNELPVRIVPEAEAYCVSGAY